MYSKDDLILSGEGILKINGNYEDGIVSKDDLKVTSGSYEIIAKIRVNNIDKYSS